MVASPNYDSSFALPAYGRLLKSHPSTRHKHTNFISPNKLRGVVNYNGDPQASETVHFNVPYVRKLRVLFTQYSYSNENL